MSTLSYEVRDYDVKRAKRRDTLIAAVNWLREQEAATGDQWYPVSTVAKGIGCGSGHLRDLVRESTGTFQYLLETTPRHGALRSYVRKKIP